MEVKVASGVEEGEAELDLEAGVVSEGRSVRDPVRDVVSELVSVRGGVIEWVAELQGVEERDKDGDKLVLPLPVAETDELSLDTGVAQGVGVSESVRLGIGDVVPALESREGELKGDSLGPGVALGDGDLVDSRRDTEAVAVEVTAPPFTVGVWAALGEGVEKREKLGLEALEGLLVPPPPARGVSDAGELCEEDTDGETEGEPEAVLVMVRTREALDLPGCEMLATAALGEVEDDAEVEGVEDTLVSGDPVGGEVPLLRALTVSAVLGVEVVDTVWQAVIDAVTDKVTVEEMEIVGEREVKGELVVKGVRVDVVDTVILGEGVGVPRPEREAVVLTVRQGVGERETRGFVGVGKFGEKLVVALTCMEGVSRRK